MKPCFTFFLFLSCSVLVGQNCYSDYSYFRPVTLKASAADSIIEGHTVAIPINTKSLFDAGKMNDTASDLRVTDANCNELFFFINDIAERERNVLYVAVPDIDESGLTIHLYYGKSSNPVSQVNGDAVFDFFDDFEDGLIDENKWEAVGEHSEWSEQNGEMRFTGVFGNGGVFQYVTPRMGFNDPMTYDFIANASNAQVYGLGDTEDRNRIGLRYGSGVSSHDTLDIIAIMNDTLNGGTNPGIVYPYVQVPRGDMNFISMSGYVNQNQEISYTHFQNYTTEGVNNDTLLIVNTEFEALRPFFASLGSAIRVEFLGIRPAVAAFPIIEFGTEEMIATSGTAFVALDLGVSLYPNPANDQLNLQISDDIPQSISILDMNGVEIIKTGFNHLIDISNLADGSYFVRLYFENGVRSIDRIIVINE